MHFMHGWHLTILEQSTISLPHQLCTHLGYSSLASRHWGISGMKTTRPKKVEYDKTHKKQVNLDTNVLLDIV